MSRKNIKAEKRLKQSMFKSTKKQNIKEPSEENTKETSPKKTTKVRVTYNCDFKYCGRGAIEFVESAAPLLSYANIKKIHGIWFSDSKAPEDTHKVYALDSMGKAHIISDPTLIANSTFSWISVDNTGVKLRVLFVIYRTKNKNILVINDPNLSDDSTEIIKQFRSIRKKDFIKRIK